MSRLCLWLVGLWLPLAAGADPIHLVYFRMPPIADETVDGKAFGPAVSLVEELTRGLDVDSEPRRLPLKRLELMAATEKVIVIGIARNPAREKLGLVWITELFRDNLHFVTLAGHPAVTVLDDARQFRNIACNLGGAPAQWLLDRGFTNVDSATDVRSEAAKLHAGHADAWFGIKLFIDYTWRGQGYDPADLHWSPPMETQPIWVAASPAVEPAVVETMRRRYADLRKEGRLDPMLARLIQ